MRKVFKYELNDSISKVDIPDEADFLKVEYQASSGKLCLWALVDTDQEQINRHTFYLIMTGADFPPEVSHPHTEHVGTVLLQGGLLVVHVFEDESKMESNISGGTEDLIF